MNSLREIERIRQEEKLKRKQEESLMEFDESGIARVRYSIPNAPNQWGKLYFGSFSSHGSSSISIESSRQNDPLVPVENQKKKISWSNYLGRRSEKANSIDVPN